MVAQLRTLSDLMSRFNIARAAGVTFSGLRKLYEALGYKTELDFEDYNGRYERGDIAARVVEVFPTYTWRGEPEVWESDNVDVQTRFEREFYDFAERVNLWAQFSLADTLTGIGRYGVLYIGGPGTDVSTPLTASSLDEIEYVLPLTEKQAKIDQTALDKDPKSKTFGLPTFYTIATDNVSAQLVRKVHASRCLHLVTEPNGSLLYGMPRLMRVWNRFDDLDKVVGGGSEAFYQRAHRGYQFDVDPDVKVTDEDKATMTAAIDEFSHNLRRILRTRGVTTTEFGSDVADFKDPMAAIVALISGATSIPQRLMLGSERGEQASTQDRDNWNDVVSERQRTIAHPRVVKPFVERMISIGAIQAPKHFYTKWPDREEQTPSEQVDMATKAADINRKQGETVVLGEEIRTIYLGLPPFTPEQKAMIAAAPDPQAEDDDNEDPATSEDSVV